MRSSPPLLQHSHLYHVWNLQHWNYLLWTGLHRGIRSHDQDWSDDRATGRDANLYVSFVFSHTSPV